MKTDSFPAFSGSGKRFGCVVRAEGSLGGLASVPYLTGALVDSLGGAWSRDSLLVGDGSSGTVYGVRRDDVLCLFRISWKIRVRYDPRAELSPYRAEVGCEQSRRTIRPRG